MRINRTRCLLLSLILLVLVAVSVEAAQFNYGAGETLLYEVRFADPNYSGLSFPEWTFEGGPEAFTLVDGGLEEGSSYAGWRRVDLDIEQAVGSALSLANKKTSVYFAARFGLVRSFTGNKLGFMFVSENEEDAGWPYLGAYLADKTTSPAQASLGEGTSYFSMYQDPCDLDPLDMTTNISSYDDFRLVYTDNLDGTLTVALDRDENQNGNWVSVASTVIQGDGSFTSDWRSETKFYGPAAQTFRLVFRDVFNGVESVGITQTDVADLFNYGANEVPCYQHVFTGENHGGFDYLTAYGHHFITTNGYLETMYDGANGVELDLNSPSAIPQADMKFLASQANHVAVYFSAKFADSATLRNRLGFHLMSADTFSATPFIGGILAPDTTGQAYLGMSSGDAGGFRNSDAAYAMTVNTADFDDFRMVFDNNGDGTLTITLDRDANQNGSWVNVYAVTVPTLADFGTDDFTDAQAFGGYDIGTLRLRYRFAGDGIGKLAIVGCSNCDLAYDVNGDCFFDLNDLAEIFPDWLSCGWSPATLCN